MSYFRVARNIELSLLYYLTNCFSKDWTGISVVKTFKDAYSTATTTPIVCIRLEQTTSGRREIGSDTLESRYLFIIDIFAKSNGQRLDLADYIKDQLKVGWIHYDHSHTSGDNTSLERLANGRDYVDNFVNDSHTEIVGSAEAKDAYRHNISISVRTNQ